MLQGANIKEDYKLLLGKAICDLNTKDCMLQQCQNYTGEEVLIAHLDKILEDWDLEESIEFNGFILTVKCWKQMFSLSMASSKNSLAKCLATTSFQNIKVNM
uniref:Uncharacterized protein n=1 Tax=Micrurus corallinus TaxID=54390 RepID=A0A2D4G155_MICCO